MGDFICTFFLLISLSFTFQSSNFNYSSSSQCCGTRMAAQMIEYYQSSCHFAGPQKRYNQKMPLVLSNTLYKNMVSDCEMIPELIIC